MYDFSQFELDHIGVAVQSLDEGFTFYQALGAKQMEIEEVASQKVRVGMLKLGNRCNIELLEPTDETSPIRGFLDKRGPGIHHMCLRVTELDSLLVDLKRHQVKVLSDTPFLGARGCRVVFVHPKSAGGVLLELSEPTGLGDSKEEER